MTFRSVSKDADFPALERDVLRQWETERTFERSVRAREGATPFIFYDGPPFATGLPHYGHILTSYIKDIVPRYQTMRGFHVPRRWGWDCHGLPVEFEVEKELGFRSRADILHYGVDKFNETCRSMVLKYAIEWRSIVTRLGRWVDFDNDYKTMDADYMESVVWVFKSLWERGLVYEGQKVVAFCTRCQTPLSNFEARQDDAFRPRTDLALSVRFRLADDPSQSMVAWTTTPWTLPSNVALAVNADVEYVRMEKGGESVWLARPALAAYSRALKDHREVESRPGRHLEGRRYRPLFPYFADAANAFRVLVADFVATDEGTGIVHLAPAFGEDDAAVCRVNGIEGPNPVQEDGTFDRHASDFAGQHVFEANRPIAQRLRSDGAILSEEQHTHNYPHCWRCDTPLIYRSITTWLIRVTDVKTKMVEANRRIRWVPEHLRDGRFGNWLENARDWAVSRSRFWGTPVPVWRCNACAAVSVIGSRDELATKSGVRVDDWHRPAIDRVEWPCECGGRVTRVLDVLDCWFESGAMPYAQTHYPFEHRAEFDASFPGDFIVEYIAQTRGWFYTLVVLAAAIFDERPFKSVICHGVILAGDGRKMSKRLKNYPDPIELVESRGSDALRIALMQSPAVRGADMRFSGEQATHDAVRRFCIPLWNCLHFFTAYAVIEEFNPTGAMPAPTRLDRYLLSETDHLRQRLEDCMDAYDVAGCYDAIEEYVVMLSTWYIRLSKGRLWKIGPSDDKMSAFEAVYTALSAVTLLIAPFLPFLSEAFGQALGRNRSVHLEDWPAPRPEWRDHALSTEMADVRTMIRLARGVRETHRISHRQPLRSISVGNLPAETIARNRDILLEELNVKDLHVLQDVDRHVATRVKLNFPRLGKRLRGEMAAVQAAVAAGQHTFAADRQRLFVHDHELDREDFSIEYVPIAEGTGVAAEGRLVVVVDLHIDEPLVVERRVRDLNRALQDLRKAGGLRYEDRIVVGIVAPPLVLAAVSEHREWLAEQTLAVDIRFAPLESPQARTEVTIDGDLRAVIMLERASAYSRSV